MSTSLLPLLIVFTLLLYQSGWPDEAFHAYQSGLSALHLHQPPCSKINITVFTLLYSKRDTLENKVDPGWCRPQWLSWMWAQLVIRRLRLRHPPPHPPHPHRIANIFSWRVDHEIFSTAILSLPLIQEGQLSVSGERMCTILVNHLEV